MLGLEEGLQTAPPLRCSVFAAPMVTLRNPGDALHPRDRGVQPLTGFLLLLLWQLRTISACSRLQTLFLGVFVVR